MRVLTYNNELSGNYSYSHTFRRLMSNTPDIDWFYGQFGVPTFLKTDLCTIVPGNLNDRRSPNLDMVVNTIKDHNIDLLFVHDDPQHLAWTTHIKGIPKVLWLPWDNHEMPQGDIQHIINTFDLVITVAKFPLPLISRIRDQYAQVYNPIDTKVFKPIEEDKVKDLKERFRIPENGRVLTWVGRPGWRKRFHHIIEVFRRVKERYSGDVYLYLHTDIKEPLPKWNPYETIYSSGCKENIRFLGDYKFQKGVDGRILNIIYNMTDVYIAPMGGEGHNLPLCEAMATETPFVATNFSTTAEFAYGGLPAKIGEMIVDRGFPRPYVDIDDMANKVLYLLNNEDERVKMGKAGKKFVLESMNASKVGNEIQSLLRLFAEVPTVEIPSENIR